MFHIAFIHFFGDAKTSIVKEDSLRGRLGLPLSKYGLLLVARELAIIQVKIFFPIHDAKTRICLINGSQ
jgi:hypothetical protein